MLQLEVVHLSAYERTFLCAVSKDFSKFCDFNQCFSSETKNVKKNPVTYNTQTRSFVHIILIVW